MPAAMAWVGAADNAGDSVLMAVGPDGRLLDRRLVALVDDGMTIHPHHHDGQRLPIDAGVALVAHVRACADRRAAAALEALAAELPMPVAGLALRRYPPLPPTVAERIQDYRAQCVADSAMFRQALADAAEARGWAVRWYDPKAVFAQAAAALGRATLDDHLAAVGKAIGPPWRKDQKLALAGALAARLFETPPPAV